MIRVGPPVYGFASGTLKGTWPSKVMRVAYRSLVRAGV